jgi:transcriptional regulator with XRE-family HTH domain
MCRGVAEAEASTGIAGLDTVLGGLIPGDNVVWVAERAGPYEVAERAFIAQAGREGRRCIYVTALHDPVDLGLGPDVEIIDARPGRPDAPPAALAAEIERRARQDSLNSFVIDDVDTLAGRWGKAAALSFFSRTCPTLLEFRALAYWRIPRACGERFLSAVRQVTQCVLDVRGPQLHVVKAESRPASVQGLVVRVSVDGDDLSVERSSASGRLALGLANLRKERHLSQAQLATLAGVTASAISQAEAGSRGLSLDTLVTMTDRLGVSLDYLLNAAPAPGYVLARHDRRRTAKPGTIPLFDDSTVGLRAYLVLLAANMAGQPHVKHKGTELIAVQRGLVQVTVGGSDTPVLRAGDSILAKRAAVTGWQNLRAEPAALFWFLRD